MFLRNILLLAFSGLSTAATLRTRISNSTEELPTIDLGYAVYRATTYNSAYDSYIFSNIRFAAPPTGPLRFGPPQPPLTNRTIQDGTTGWVCPQSEASHLEDGRSTEPASEDCLFLDVIVPRSVLNGEHGDVDVLFWIYGGGYTLGTKTQQGLPFTFLEQAPSPIIWVAPSYRLGIFGWLGGPTFTIANGTVPNAGLHDQRFALEWVQRHIHLFHGDKDSVTVMGVSAGAGSIMHHITAYGGSQGATLFKRAVPIGPGFYLVGGHARAEEGYKGFEAMVGCTGKGVECIRALDTEVLIKANEDFVFGTQAPSLGPGPVVDGNYVPDVPSYLLAQNRFHKDISILVIDDINEGYIFMPQNSSYNTPESLAAVFPNISNATLASLLALYPPPSNSTPYSTEFERASKIIADTAFDCNRYALSVAMADRAWNLVSSIMPGFHGTFAYLVYADIAGADQVSTREVREGMRRMLLNFVVRGDPNEVGGGVGPDGVMWPVFGTEMKGLDVSGTGMTLINVGGDKEVCEWWAKGLVLS